MWFTFWLKRWETKLRPRRCMHVFKVSMTALLFWTRSLKRMNFMLYQWETQTRFHNDLTYYSTIKRIVLEWMQFADTAQRRVRELHLQPGLSLHVQSFKNYSSHYVSSLNYGGNPNLMGNMRSGMGNLRPQGIKLATPASWTCAAVLRVYWAGLLNYFLWHSGTPGFNFHKCTFLKIRGWELDFQFISATRL